jgi:hypothetical protein
MKRPHLTPRPVIAYNANERESLPYGGIVLEAIKAERAVAEYYGNLACGPMQSCTNCKWSSDPEAAERARVHPAAGSTRPKGGRECADNIAPVTDHSSVVLEKCADCVDKLPRVHRAS